MSRITLITSGAKAAAKTSRVKKIIKGAKSLAKAYKIGLKTRKGKSLMKLAVKQNKTARKVATTATRLNEVGSAKMANFYGNVAKQININSRVNAAASKTQMKARNALNKKGGLVKIAGAAGANTVNALKVGAAVGVGVGVANRKKSGKSLTFRQKLALRKAQKASAAKRSQN